MTAQFRVLGDIEILVHGRPVDVGHARLQAVLAVLLIDANQVVPVDEFVDRVWGQTHLPENPRGALRTYLSHVRRALTETDGDDDGVALVRRAPGYKLVVDEQRVDMHRFGELLNQARAAGEDDQAAALIDEALGLWRREPFAGLDTPWINATRRSLGLQRQAARLDLTDILLRRGRHAELLAGLTDQAAQYPLDERVAGQLMLALYRDGRQADALAHYQHVRRQLADELGADPGPALHRLHQQILTADAALTVTTAGRPAVLPRQLPAAPRRFTGRARELARLTETRDEQADSGATPVISAIGGAGGIGKTWLALHWAHQHLDRFPDGQLYVNLRGFDPSGEPMPPATAVRGFLDALGVAANAVPAELDAQAGLYRSLVAGKRMLIVADNARDAAQVVPLLPGSATCTVLVTSRSQLTGLISAHGAHAVSLDVLPREDARHLLAGRLGRARVTAEPDAVTALLDYCAGLPLALSVVAASALTRPELPLSMLAAELRDASARLDALAGGDLAANVRAVLSWSYDALDPETAGVLELLASAPGPDVGLPGAASLLARPAAATRALLRELEHASLLQQHAPGRYRMHDLVRLYAADRDRSSVERDAALRRMLDFYTHTAHGAARLLAPHRQPIRLDPPAPGTHPHELPDASAATAWLDLEHSNLLAAQHTAATRSWHPTVWQLAWTLDTFHRHQGRLHDRLAAWRAAVEAADHLPDPATRSLAHRLLGLAYADLGRHEEAIRHLHESLALAERDQNPTEQAHTHLWLARAWEQRGDDRQALNHATRGLELFRALEQPIQQADALNAVGWYAARVGEYETALTHCRAAVAVYRAHDDVAGEAATLDSLGYVEHRAGHHHQAVELYQQALALYSGLGNTYESSDVLDHLGHPHAALGQHEQARTAWCQALDLYRRQERDDEVERMQRQIAALTRPRAE